MRILLVDDHKNTRLTLGTILRRDGHEVETAATGIVALHMLEAEAFGLVITDLHLGDIDGMKVVEKVCSSHQDTKVVVITAFGTIASAVRALKLGASDYVTKPVQREQILSIVDKIAADVTQGRSAHATAGIPGANLQPFIGRSPGIAACLELTDRIAQADVPVLILGESGTGKELIARRIHELSPRRAKPFVAINCGALPENLQESELFGHRKGAFTGAIEDKKGLIEEAAGGTVLLDEIAEMSLSTQVKLLRALQDGEMRPVGGTDVQYMQCRILASTNKDLRPLVEAKRFRDDLLFRLNVMQIQIPPLRERGDDIVLLAQYFLERFIGKYGKQITGLTPEALSHLRQHAWPGNVRELKNCIERAVFLSHSASLDLEDVVQHTAVPLQGGAPRLLEKQESALIQEILQKHRWNQKHAAAELGIGETTLWRKIKKFGLKREENL